ncbi:MAG: 16S rRNA (cytosine(1402)-N(4))-methyltransferase RsmH [Parcubacteria group bacterium]|nr:16S rRNA (cytosine(1402)-N(4))-methyltransferase RsmH [Parcubacteria group bacterium]
MTSIVHEPVLLIETIKLLNLKPSDVVVDATVGEGGHALAIAETIGSTGHLLLMDRDEEALAIATARVKSLASQPRVSSVHSSFGFLRERLRELYIPHVNAILADLGLSSRQLSDPARGFSFLTDGPLDMRFDSKEEIPTAGEIVNTARKEELAKLFTEFGEEEEAEKIAAAIITQRKATPLTRTRELADLVARVKSKQTAKIHPATKVFQALRIAVNHEFAAIETFLPQAFSALSQGGRLAVITFHSLEDRIVKHFFLIESRGYEDIGQLIRHEARGTPRGTLITPHPIRPSFSEVTRNPRARSAKLRVIEKR